MPPIASPPLVQITGPLILSHLFNWGLFGALTVQAYVYYVSFPNDPKKHKCLVLFVYIVQIVQVVFAAMEAFQKFGNGWGDFAHLGDVGLGWFGIPILNAIITLTAQLFYAWRVWVLGSRRVVLPAIIILLSITQGTAAIIAGVETKHYGDWIDVSIHLYKLSAIWLGGTALCDIVIAGSMIYYLRWSQTGFRQTDVMLTKLMRLTMETGALCAGFAIIDLSLFLAYRYNNYHLPLCGVLAGLYTNSLLAVLNSRMNIVGGRNTTEFSSGEVLDSMASFDSRHPNRSTLASARTAPRLRPHSNAYTLQPPSPTSHRSIVRKTQGDRRVTVGLDPVTSTSTMDDTKVEAEMGEEKDAKSFISETSTAHN